MKTKITLGARLLLGFIFFASGIVGLLNIYPMPDNLPEALTAFNKGLLASRYFFPLLKGTETICGLLLLIGAFVPLALVILAPIVVNIILVHAFLAPDGLPVAMVIGGLMIYLSFFAEPYAAIVKQIFRCPLWEAKRAISRNAK